MELRGYMSKYLFIYLFFLFLNIKVFGQNVNVYGSVISISKCPINSASVILKDSSGKLISYTFSDDLGIYKLSIKQKGQFTIIANALGYESQKVVFQIQNIPAEKQINLELTQSSHLLKEVVVEARRPIVVKQDTIVFDASDFSLGNVIVIEDLLKRIPGLNVGTDGSIKVGNQEIEKIMIDGDDMFDRGYKILTKNMPVTPIDKVEILKRFSNNKYLHGIEKSEKVALNLTLKNNFKRKWFGNGSIGDNFASDNRHEIRGSLMNFGKKDKFVFLTNHNNIGYDATGDIYNLIKPSSFEEVGSIGDNESANILLYLGFNNPKLKSKRVNFNNTNLISINSIFNLSKSVKLTVTSFLNKDKVNFYRNSTQSVKLNNTAFENFEDLDGIKDQSTFFSKIHLEYTISKNKAIEYVSKVSDLKERNTSRLIFNSNPLAEKLYNDNSLVDQKIIFSNKLNQNKALIVSGRYITDIMPQNYSVNQFIFQGLFDENADNVRQYSMNRMIYYGIETHFLDRKKNNNLFELKMGNQFRIDYLKTSLQLLREDTSISFPVLFQNDVKFTVNDAFISSKYLFYLGKLSISTQANLHNINNQFQEYMLSQTANSIFVVPKVGIDWNISTKNKLVTSYSFNTTNTGVLDIQPRFVMTDFRSFSRGIEGFRQLSSSGLFFNHTYGSWGEKIFANTSLVYTRNNNFLSSNSLVNQNYSLIEKILIRNQNMLNISSSLDYYLKQIKSNIKITLGNTMINSKNIVNNSELRDVQMSNIDYGAEIRSGFKGYFNYHFGVKWNYSQVKAISINSYKEDFNFLDILLTFNENLNVQLQLERYYFGTTNVTRKPYYFFDLDAKYVIKHNKLIIFVSGNNLINTRNFRVINVSDIGVSRTEYRLQPRYLLFKIEYRF